MALPDELRNGMEPGPAVFSSQAHCIFIIQMNATDFENWQSFEKELQDYLEETFQHFVVSNNTPISYRNKKIAAQHPNDPSRLLPETLVSYVRTYKCTHGGQPRKRGTGARPQQHARQIGCPAKVSVSFAMVDTMVVLGTLCDESSKCFSQLNVGVKQVGDDTWIVRVTQHVREHNHNVSESVYNRYPHVRQRMSTETQRHVQALISAKTPYRIILDMLRSGGNEHIRMKDLHNIAQKLSSNRKWRRAK
ncbi:TPA: hypothetical protein N0F65_011454 [Lagenidium giganteum]|uniref:FAR1 domain-containing protein n=1 Tax=Lagenidium giganteum TaxID=4803 RepID=A0AAV2Z802_9STRA|nr:TPA: hypothetical protein N0F65_011454 [Lagenidium giganteum]